MLGKIRRMHFRDKISVREIARRTGLSRNTVREWLKRSEMTEPEYPKRTSPSRLDP
jgi:IS30 family transposase